MTETEINALAREVIELAAVACVVDEEWKDIIKAQPIIWAQTGNVAFLFTGSTDTGQVEAILDPLPYVTTIINRYLTDNIPLNKDTFVYLTLEMLKR
ncbi:MAG TPA: hypothetical protein VF528_14565 [Pyrinomonadaceae bacterium]